MLQCDITIMRLTAERLHPTGIYPDRTLHWIFLISEVPQGSVLGPILFVVFLTRWGGVGSRGSSRSQETQ